MNKTSLHRYVKIITTIGVLILCLNSVASNQELFAPKIELSKIEPVSVSLTALRLNIHLSVHNENSQDIKVSSLSYAFSLNNKLVKQEKIFREEHLPSNEVKNIAIPVTITYQEANLLSLLPSLTAAEETAYRLEGQVALKGYDKPFTFFLQDSIRISDYVSFQNLNQFQVKAR